SGWVWPWAPGGRNQQPRQNRKRPRLSRRHAIAAAVNCDETKDLAIAGSTHPVLAIPLPPAIRRDPPSIWCSGHGRNRGAGTPTRAEHRYHDHRDDRGDKDRNDYQHEDHVERMDG